jgi:hypothetical protein
MPMWEPASNDVAIGRPAPSLGRGQPGQFDQPPVRPSGRKAHKPSRRVADPFDPADDGANCLRCGYVIEPARERRGLMTCAECGSL